MESTYAFFAIRYAQGQKPRWPLLHSRLDWPGQPE
jgi:hypothetical protein